MMHPQGKIGKVYHWRIVWRQFYTSKPPMENPRFKPRTFSANLQKAFLQIWIKKEDRDALRFHRVKKEDPSQAKVFRFARLVFGLVQFPFISKGTIDERLNSYTEEYPAEVAEMMGGLYVDDLITGGENFEQVRLLKDIALKIFYEAGFKLHKWHSNVPVLEGKKLVNETD